jgi:hypothetical protein
VGKAIGRDKLYGLYKELANSSDLLLKGMLAKAVT